MRKLLLNLHLYVTLVAGIFVVILEDSQDSHNVRMRFPEDRTPGGRSWVSIDQYSGKVLVAQNSRTAPLAVRASLMNREIHTGDVFGTPSRIVMSASSFLESCRRSAGW